ncbi:hypothetical protein TanjilG_21577 [Lupinus angustifolius]|uniref:Uncharacterized protein n=1 Tax=Lupinus angustifolius TaxID=3871 RepID=A0A4P1QUI9_LUPAN|nr:hypothetical protein TanjilG_21577 [Lupinus angustifolius]
MAYPSSSVSSPSDQLNGGVSLMSTFEYDQQINDESMVLNMMEPWESVLLQPGKHQVTITTYFKSTRTL